MSWHPSLKKPHSFSQNLASAALSSTTALGRKFKLEQVILKSSVAITEKVSVYLDSVLGSNYDTILYEEFLSNESNFVYKPEGEANFEAGDEIRIECTNANGLGTVYGQIKTSEILQ